MGSLPKVLRSIRESIGSFLDLLDFLGYLNILTFAGSGGGTVVGWLYQIPTWAVVLLFIVVITSAVTIVIRVLVRYKKWLAIKDERKACLDIPIVPQRMHDRLGSLTDNYARVPVDENQFQEALYQFGANTLRDNLMLLRRLARRRPKMAHIREFVDLLASYFNEYDIGLRGIRDGDDKEEGSYQVLKVRLAELVKTIGSEEVKGDIDDFLRLSYQACFGQLYQRRFVGIENKPIQAKLSVRYDKMNDALSKKIFRIQKKILRYWRWEI